MRVFKFNSGEYYYAVSGNTEDEAREALFEQMAVMPIDSVEEIPESEWDEPKINIWEDNDFDKEPYKVSIREEMGGHPQLVFTNDFASF